MSDSVLIIALVVGMPFVIGIGGVLFLAIKSKIETGLFYVKRDSD